MSEPAGSRVSAWSAVSDGLSVGWDRMVYLLFRGPGANPGGWALWGLILMIAGVGSANVGSNWNVPSDEDVSYPGPDTIEPWMIVVGVAGVMFLYALVVVWLYFRSRFRFVMLEGVRTGKPRIREVFGTTRRAGGHYFLFELALSLGTLLLLAPLLVAWIPVATGLYRGELDVFQDAWLLLIVTVLWVLTVSITVAVVQWWVYDLVLPYVWLSRIDFLAGLDRAWRLTRDRLDAVLVLLVMRVLVGVAGALAGCLLGCASCVLWIWPALAIGLAVMASIALPPLWIVTVPLILLLALVVAWIMAVVTAPIPLLYRSWSCAFLNRLDPSLPLWDEAGDGAGVS